MRPTQSQIDQATQDYLRRQANTFAECALNLMVSTVGIPRTIKWLEKQIDILKEFG
jgi:hypothetical protein